MYSKPCATERKILFCTTYQLGLKILKVLKTFSCCNVVWNDIFNYEECRIAKKIVMVDRVSHLLMLLHRGVELLGQVIGYIRHPRLFLIGSADAALVFVGFLVILLFGILAVSLSSLGNRWT